MITTEQNNDMTQRAWVALLFVAMGVLSWQLGSLTGYRQLERTSLEESFRYSQLIGNELKRYSPIVELMAQHPVLINALNSPDNPQLILEANKIMALMGNIVASSDVYLMDHSGLTIAASNYQQQASFIGRNFSFRPYFYEAVESGSSSLYFALGITSELRGLYFSHPVMQAAPGNTPAGVIVMKIQVTELEAQWQRPADFSESEMAVIDGDGISFLTSRPGWLYRQFAELSDSGRAQLEAEQRYAGRELLAMDMTRLGHVVGTGASTERVVITDDVGRREFLAVRSPLPELDWNLLVLANTRPVLWAKLKFTLGGMLLLGGVLLGWLYLRERYRREAELAQRGEQLERRVAARTADLEQTNERLLEEVRERKRAEDELKEAQQELIQAAKLAVLGQMSAGLNHEMNQPLTAIQAYARNSQRFLERGDLAMVHENLGEIGVLCNKMSELTRQFKIFARKSEGLPSRVDLRLAVDAALKIITAQQHSDEVKIDWLKPPQPVIVHGDLIRIEQVLVNLIANAVQAVETVEAPHILIDLMEDGDYMQCRIRDNGPGLQASTEQIFEPFFTTKSIKQGLGLGLSISRQILDALGGRLTGRNREDAPGAEFTFTLRRGSEDSSPPDPIRYTERAS